MDTNPKARFGALKPNLALVPPASMIYQALAMQQGAEKYGPYNWRKDKVSTMTYVAAAKRHLDQYLDGEHLDPESGFPHLAHAMASLGILIDALETGNLIDDRPAPGAAGHLIRKWTKKDDSAPSDERQLELPLESPTRTSTIAVTEYADMLPPSVRY